MRNLIVQRMDLLRMYISMKTNQVVYHWLPFAVKVLAFGIIVLLILQKDINLNLSLNNERLHEIKDIASNTTPATANDAYRPEVVPLTIEPENKNPVYQSTIIQNTPAPKTTQSKAPKNGSGDNLANTYSNMVYEAEKQHSPVSKYALKRKKQMDYVKRFAKVAQAEMKKYGIPASITLAQGLIESNAGESRLSVKNNNHFGMKCFSKKCKKGHCSNFTDDSHKDFFRKYNTAWDSYRAHSLLLKGKRYRPLFQLKKKDYKAWSHGLKKAGYATDRHYAKKLIALIEDLKLYQFDTL